MGCALFTVSMHRTCHWKAAGEVLESDKCQEKLITGKVRCQGINCSPSRGRRTDGQAVGKCAHTLCCSGGGSYLHKSLFTQHSPHVQWGSRCYEGCGCGRWPLGPWVWQRGKAENSGNPQPLQLFWGVGTWQSAVECTLLVSEGVPLRTGLTGRGDRQGCSVS